MIIGCSRVALYKLRKERSGIRPMDHLPFTIFPLSRLDVSFIITYEPINGIYSTTSW